MNFIQRYLLCAFLVLVVSLLSAGKAHGQGVVYSQQDINSTGGSFTGPTSGSYQLVGKGTGLNGTSDSISYLYTPAYGSIELISSVQWQNQPSSNYAIAGLSIRSSIFSSDGTPNSSAAEATISVSQGNGCNFTYRAADGGTTSVSLGPSVTAPISPSTTPALYLRLVKSGSEVAGYYSTDRINWTLVGSTQMVLPSNYFVGFTASSAISTAAVTANFSSISYLINVPQRSANLLLWLRSDVGITADGSNRISMWADQSGYGNHSTQTVTGSQPTLNTSGISGGLDNNLPFVYFDTTSGGQFFRLPNGFSTFTQGASIFAVIRPHTVPTNPGRIVELGNTSAVNDLMLAQQSNTANSLWVFNGGTGSSVSSSNGAGLDHNQLIEAVHNGLGTATIYTNGVQGGTGSVSNINTINRTNNAIGRYAGGGNNFNGYIQELIVMNRPVTTAERQALESYFYSKFGVGPASTLAAPIITPHNVVVSSPPVVSIAADPQAVIYYTTDGSQPVPGQAGTTKYTGSFVQNTNATINAIATAPYAITASSSSFIQFDPLASIPKSGLQLWLRSDLGVGPDGINPVSSWSDLSGNARDAVQNTSGNRPTVTSGAINGHPAITFTGTSSQYLTLPSGFADFTQGITCFIVGSPTTVSAQQYMFTVSTGGGTNEISYGFLPTSNTAIFDVDSGSSGSRVSSVSGYTTGVFNNFEAVHNGNANASVFRDGAYITQGTMFNAPNLNRTVNYIGRRDGVSYLTGKIAEILLYNRQLNPGERKAVEAYISNRYFNTLISSPQTGVYSTNQTVSLAAGSSDTIKYTTDGTDPSSSGTALTYSTPISVTKPTLIKAATTAAPSTVVSSYIDIDLTAAGVPRDSMILWLRPGIGFWNSTTLRWTDMSGAGADATYPTYPPPPPPPPPYTGPLVAAKAIHGYDAITQGSTLNLPAGFNSFKGLSIFALSNPTLISGAGGMTVFSAATSTGDLIKFWNDANVSGSTTKFSIQNGSAGSPPILATANNCVTNRFLLWEAVQNGSGSGTISFNGVPNVTGTVTNPNSVYRNSTSANSAFIGYGISSELILYSRTVTATEQANIESYFMNKYGLPQTTPNAPIISVPTSNLSAPADVSIYAPPGVKIFTTQDGTSPTTLSTPYTGPIHIAFTQTLKAITYRDGITSSVSSATYTLNSTTYPAPDPSDHTTPTIQLNLPTNAL